METKGKSYIIRELKAKKVQFGWLSVLTSREDFRGANVVYVGMTKPDMPHHHVQATEFHFVVQGIGRIKLDGKEESIVRNQLIMIEPGTIHCVAPGGHPAIMGVLIVSVPAHNQGDEVFALDQKKYGFEGEEDQR